MRFNTTRKFGYLGQCGPLRAIRPPPQLGDWGGRLLRLCMGLPITVSYLKMKMIQSFAATPKVRNLTVYLVGLRRLPLHKQNVNNRLPGTTSDDAGGSQIFVQTLEKPSPKPEKSNFINGSVSRKNELAFIRKIHACEEFARILWQKVNSIDNVYSS